jgi:hypothetical protein
VGELLPHNVRPWPREPGGEVVDVLIRDGRIAGRAPDDVPVEDGRGGVLLPALTDVRDYWSPYGNGDVLERSWQLAFRSGYRLDEVVELCVDVASRGGRSIVDGTGWSDVAIAIDAATGLAPGAVADLVVVDADTVTAAVMDHPPRTLVIDNGRVIARDGELV